MGLRKYNPNRTGTIAKVRRESRAKELSHLGGEAVEPPRQRETIARDTIGQLKNISSILYQTTHDLLDNFTTFIYTYYTHNLKPYFTLFPLG